MISAHLSTFNVYERLCFNRFGGLFYTLLKRVVVVVSVPDPELVISDPDPDHQIENQEFRIRILL